MATEDVVNGFPDGSLTKVVFHNFLTFDDLIFLPGPNLNVIIGPNGNGKSSIICGICLAVGGDPKVLGRSAEITDYLKHGCAEGFVEVHIHDSQRTSDFCARIVLRTGKSAEYFVNGSHIARNGLRKLIAGYNIQIENPCTFLAQDKVRSFAEQNPHLLLKNTEKASSSELCELHETLEKLQENGAKHASTHDSLQRRAAAVVNELNSLESLVKNYEERKKALERIEILEKKDAFLDYCIATDVYKKRKAEFKSKNREIEQINKIVVSTERELDEKKEAVQKIRDESAKKQQLDEQINKAIDATSVGTRIKQARDDYERIQKECESWEREVNIVKKEICSLSERLKAAEKESSRASAELKSTRIEYSNWRAREEKLESQRCQINDLQTVMRQGKEELEILARQEQQFEKDKQAIFANNSLSRKLHCLEAWRWYEEHKSEFQYPVYIPLLFISLKNAEDAKYLENVIASRDYLMFIFGSKEDELRLTNSSFPWRISSTVMTPDEVEKNNSEQVIPEQLRRFGFHHMVSELYYAPAPVKAYLNNLFHLNKIPIGDATTDTQLEETCATVKDLYRLFLTGTSRVQIIVSRYSGELSIRTDNLRKNISWLMAHVPPGNLQKQEDKLQKQKDLKDMEAKAKLQKEHDTAKAEIDASIEGLRRKMAELRKQVDAAGLMKQQLRSKEIRLSSMEESKPNLQEAKRAMEECKQSALSEGFSKAKEILKLLKNSSHLERQVIVAKLNFAAGKEDLDELNDKLSISRTEINKKKAEVEDYEKVVKGAKKEVLESSERLKLKTGVSTTFEGKLSLEEGKIFNKLLKEFEAVGAPDDREDLHSALNAEKARLVAMQDEGGKKALDRYQKLLEVHEDLKKHLESSSGQVESWEKEMDSLLGKWVNSLKQLIANINRNFDKFFRRLGCAGEVCLEEPSDKRNIAAYGIDIMVRFRASERMRRLTHQAQSGGERSVTTMLYLLALQELCPVPFRCVDEINQGMDPTNERMVFEMMVSLLSGVGNLAKTQYFLLTPKLLHGLHYGERAIIHCVYNGVTFPKEGFDIAKDFKRACSVAIQ